ncbi:MAG: peptidase [Actinobacteria bacterium]|nr:MAG: peptidase [Actinomycetota bacterium]
MEVIVKRDIIVAVLLVLSPTISACGLSDLQDAVGGKSEQKTANLRTAVAGASLATELVKEDSLEEELEIGRSVGAQVLGAAKLYPAPTLQNYVNLIGRNIASQSERPDLPWSFGVIDTASINAFAAPGGYILLTKGLIDIIETEDELAAVLGHEIAHIIRKHHFNVIKKQKVVKFGATAISNAKNNNEMVKQLSGMVGEILARGLDKSAEYEADRDGIVLCGRAGYDTSSLLGVFDKLEARGRKGSTMALLVATHPSPDQRRIELANLINPEIESVAIPSPTRKRWLSVKPK